MDIAQGLLNCAKGSVSCSAWTLLRGRTTVYTVIVLRGNLSQGGGDLARQRRAGDSRYQVVRARRPTPPPFCLLCQALVLFSMVRPGRGMGRAGGRAHGQPAQHPQHPTRPQHWFTTAVMRRWRTAAVAAFPHTQHRRSWVREVCLLQPVDRIAPGAVRMQNLLAGCWDGIRHAPGAELLLDNAELWMNAVPVPGGATRRVRLFTPGPNARPPIGGSPPFGGCGPSPGIRGVGSGSRCGRLGLPTPTGALFCSKVLMTRAGTTR